MKDRQPRQRATEKAAVEVTEQDPTPVAADEGGQVQEPVSVPMSTEPQVLDAGNARTRAARSKGPKGPEKPKQRRFKAQIALRPTEYWQLKVQAASEDKNPCDLVREWIGERLAEYQYPPKPGWLRVILAEEKQESSAA